jgi:hypothetical protein
MKTETSEQKYLIISRGYCTKPLNKRIEAAAKRKCAVIPIGKPF